MGAERSHGARTQRQWVEEFDAIVIIIIIDSTKINDTNVITNITSSERDGGRKGLMETRKDEKEKKGSARTHISSR